LRGSSIHCRTAFDPKIKQEIRRQEVFVFKKKKLLNF